jgi:hypothetical protein
MGDSLLDPCFYISKKLRMGAIADAQHDFFGTSLADLGFPDYAGSWKFDVNLYLGLDAACPDDPKAKNPKKEPVKDEDPLLYDLFEDAGSPYGIRDDKSNFTEKLIGVLKRESFELNIPELNKHHDYTIKLLNKGGITNTKRLFTNKLLTSADLIAFFGSSHIDILTDTDNIYFTKMLRDVIKRDGSFSVNKIINREYINDPAPKSCDDTDCITNIIDIDKNHSVYGDHFENLFYSKYFLFLDSLTNINTSHSLNTHFFIHASGGQSLYETKDSRNNTIKALCESMWDPETNTFLLSPDELSARYQAKRAGDWLQALSCLDMKRLYASKDMHNKYVNHYKLNDHAILVTIDRILVWYCLLIGVDVVYLNKDNLSAILFKKNVVDVKAGNKHSAENNANNEPRPRKRSKQTGGTNKPPQELFTLYIKQLIGDLDLFEEDDSDYIYYKYVAAIVLACIKNTPRTPADKYYKELTALFYNSLPCDEGTMETKNEDIAKFFDNEFTSGCVAFAGRQIALHSLGQRTGTIHISDEYVIVAKVYTTYKTILGKIHDKSKFESNKYLIGGLNDAIKTAPKIHNTSSGIGAVPLMKTGFPTASRAISPPKHTLKVGGKRNKTRKLKVRS